MDKAKADKEEEMTAAKSQESKTCVVGGGKKYIKLLCIEQGSNTRRKTDL